MYIKWVASANSRNFPKKERGDKKKTNKLDIGENLVYIYLWGAISLGCISHCGVDNLLQNFAYSLTGAFAFL